MPLIWKFLASLAWFLELRFLKKLPLPSYGHGPLHWLAQKSLVAILILWGRYG